MDEEWHTKTGEPSKLVVSCVMCIWYKWKMEMKATRTSKQTKISFYDPLRFVL